MSFIRLAARSIPRPAVFSRLAITRPALATQSPAIWRSYSAAAGLTKEDITARVLETIKDFEKVDPSKLTVASSFDKDLGLDSLDTVEVVMSVEEEFAIEIPDAEADEIKTVQQAIDYIAKTPEAR